MKKAISYFAFLIVSGFIFSACVHNPAEENVTTNESTVPVTGEVMEKDGDNTVTEEGRVITMDMGAYFFKPNIIEASPGETITVKVDNVGGFHDFVIDELGVRTEQVNTGNSVIATFTIPEDASGEVYEFYCSVGNHREQGMVGLLRVK